MAQLPDLGEFIFTGMAHHPEWELGFRHIIHIDMDAYYKAPVSWLPVRAARVRENPGMRPADPSLAAPHPPRCVGPSLSPLVVRSRGESWGEGLRRQPGGRRYQGERATV